MKKFYVALLLLSIFNVVDAQDEGTIVKKERIEKSRGIFVSGGPSFTLGKDIGDYSKGFNVEVGYLKRLNRVISIGPSFSYMSFKYDPTVTSEGYNDIFRGGPYQDPNSGIIYYQGLYIALTGGDISMMSASLNVKLNLIPVTNNTKVSFYVFAKPFVSMAQRKEITGQAAVLETQGDPDDPNSWYVRAVFDWTAHSPYPRDNYNFDISDDLKAVNKLTGGIFIGPGIEFIPAKGLSIFVQSSIGYTLPVSFINSKKYSNDVKQGNDLDYFIQNNGVKYPTYSKGFSSINVQAGLSFNF